MGMGTRRRRQRQERLWISHSELVNGPAHPFYKRVNELLEAGRFDEFAEKECARFYAENNGRPSVAPGIYFRLLLVGYFQKGSDPERGIAWRAADSIGLRKFLGVGLDEQTPDHSTISRTRRLIDVETHRESIFLDFGIAERSRAAEGQDRGNRRDHAGGQRGDAIDRAARQWRELRGISERVGEKESGIDTPTREDLARFDRTRKNKDQQRGLGQSA